MRVDKQSEGEKGRERDMSILYWHNMRVWIREAPEGNDSFTPHPHLNSFFPVVWLMYQQSPTDADGDERDDAAAALKKHKNPFIPPDINIICHDFGWDDGIIS